MDTATGYVVGWVISVLPNADTIAEAFCRACVITVGDMAKGIPRSVMTDCGRDYKSKLLGDECSSYSIEHWEEPFLNRRFEGDGLFPAMSVKIYRSLPCHPQSKPIERMFRILEEKYISKQPGWCHNSVADRPDGFAKKLDALLREKKLLTLEEFVSKFEGEFLPAYHGLPTPPEETSEAEGMSGWMLSFESMSPAQRYSALDKAKTLVPDWKTLGILKRHYYPDSAVVSHRGVRFQKVYYTDEALAAHVGDRVDILISHLNQYPGTMFIFDNVSLMKTNALEKLANLRTINEDGNTAILICGVQKLYDDLYSEKFQPVTCSITNRLDEYQMRGMRRKDAGNYLAMVSQIENIRLSYPAQQALIATALNVQIGGINAFTTVIGRCITMARATYYTTGGRKLPGQDKMHPHCLSGGQELSRSGAYHHAARHARAPHDRRAHRLKDA